MKGSSSPKPISTKQARIAELARQMPDKQLYTLSHHMDLPWLEDAYRRTRKSVAPGVDGQSGHQYEAKLQDNLQSLLNRAKQGDSYRAPPVRRVYIPKGDGQSVRPLGIPTFEDKVLQRAVVMLLEPLYEQDFLDSSYGFRPGRGAHQALQRLRDGLMEMKGGWVLELDIESFFDTVDHAMLRQMLRKRVGDGVVLRLIGKWLKAGVMEEGRVYRSETGTPQGGVISPLLANVYLHEVLDVWFQDVVTPRLRGRAMQVRYADDAVLAFERQDDARRVQAVIGERFAKYGLRLHPDKTRLVRFKRPPKDGDRSDTDSFDLLGFTHFWGRSRKGNWVILRKTSKQRVSRTMRAIGSWLRTHRHEPLKEQHAGLCSKLRGHFGYYGLAGNMRALRSVSYHVLLRWHFWLNRRSHRHLSWEAFARLLRRYPLPQPRLKSP